MKTGFRTNIYDPTGSGNDLGELFVPRALFSAGGLWTWGANVQAELGDNTLVPKSSPVQTVAGGTNWKQVACGTNHSAAIKTDGTLWLWGGGNNGSLGINTFGGRSSPVQTVAGGTNWKQVEIGTYLTAAVKTDGTLWLWGFNNFGQLGDNTVANKSSPVQTISAGANWKQVASGGNSTVAVKTDGTLWTWGSSVSGELGNNTTTSSSSPVQTVAGGTNWKQVDNGSGHMAAIKTDGTLWTWGSSLGLGDNTTTNKSSPVQTVAGGTNWKQVACGGFHTAAIKTDGSLWTWGSNSYGALGDNTVTLRRSPVQTISAGTNWKQVAGGLYYTAAIKTDGTLWLWGRNNYGNLGNNTITDRSSPVQVISGGTNWKQVATGHYVTAVVKDDY
jgi:alpha-tubulin suppressor-like RCC1 family protein